jgi:vacuolar-type H+-ATPase subunit I/STV1
MCNINDTNARFHAVLSAYLSIVAGLCEFVMSSMAGSEEISMSLYGITLMATLDVTGSVLVLMRWQGSSEVQGLVEYIKELKYSMIIGVLMVLLGLFLIVDSVMKFINEDKPTENDELGPIVAIFGFVASMILAIYKFVVGKVLDSAVVTADAISSLCSGFASLAALIVVYIGITLY